MLKDNEWTPFQSKDNIGKIRQLSEAQGDEYENFLLRYRNIDDKITRIGKIISEFNLQKFRHFDNIWSWAYIKAESKIASEFKEVDGRDLEKFEFIRTIFSKIIEVRETATELYEIRNPEDHRCRMNLPNYASGYRDVINLKKEECLWVSFNAFCVAGTILGLILMPKPEPTPDYRLGNAILGMAINHYGSGRFCLPRC